MVTKIVFTKGPTDFLDEYDLDVQETFDLGDLQAAKVEISSDAGVETLLDSLRRDDRIEGVEDSFDAHLR